MDNLLLPAYPVHVAVDEKKNAYITSADLGLAGFTKLEKAALMIAQGLSANPNHDSKDYKTIARWSVDQAKAVLEEANK